MEQTGLEGTDVEEQAMRIGVVGCGELGVIHARRLGGMPGVEVVALCDPRPEAVRRAAAELPDGPRVETDDYSAFLRAPLDAVCIASPDALHVAQVVAALESGRHVLCEKPLTLDLSGLAAVVAARDSAGRIVSLTTPRRHDGGIRAIRREIASGRWGAVRSIAIHTAEDWITPNAGTWRHDPDLCPGGFFWDAGIHQLDTALWCSGLEPEEVRAQVDTLGTRVPLSAWGTARLTGGVPLAFSFYGGAHAWREHVAIHCEKADFMVENFHAQWTQAGRIVPVAPREPDEEADAVFVRIVREGGTPWATPESMTPVTRLVRAALQSARPGESITADT